MTKANLAFGGRFLKVILFGAWKPLRKGWEEPEETAAVVCFARRPEASWVNGSIVVAEDGIDASIRPDCLRHQTG